LGIDTGMQRVGVHPHAADAIVAAIRDRAPALRLAGVSTHLAVADEPSDPATGDQLERFEKVLVRIGPVPLVHAANSAGALAHPRARYDMVRVGIAMYGISPGPGVDHLCAELRPAMQVRSRVSFVKQVRAGSRISYGLRHRFRRDTNVATLPIGYADGVSRRLWSTGGEVLIGGRRCPIVGVVTMDQLMVDCGDADVRRGDDAVLLGEQDGPTGAQRISAEDWATRLDTIGYEVVCGISGRVPRVPRRSIVD
jgi:alanine racemase